MPRALGLQPSLRIIKVGRLIVMVGSLLGIAALFVSQNLDQRVFAPRSAALLLILCLVLFFAAVWGGSLLQVAAIDFSSVDSATSGQPIPQFLPGDQRRARSRLLFWSAMRALTCAGWIVSYLFAFAQVIVGQFSSGALTVGVIGSAVIMVWAVVIVYFDTLTTRGANMRSLANALPGGLILPNHTSATLAAFGQALGLRPALRASSRNYLSIDQGFVRIWRAEGTYLVPVVAIARSAVRDVRLARVATALGEVDGLELEWGQSTGEPVTIGLCPVRHVSDWAASAVIVRDRLVGTPT